MLVLTFKSTWRNKQTCSQKQWSLAALPLCTGESTSARTLQAALLDAALCPAVPFAQINACKKTYAVIEQLAVWLQTKLNRKAGWHCSLRNPSCPLITWEPAASPCCSKIGNPQMLGWSGVLFCTMWRMLGASSHKPQQALAARYRHSHPSSSSFWRFHGHCGLCVHLCCSWVDVFKALYCGDVARWPTRTVIITQLA